MADKEHISADEAFAALGTLRQLYEKGAHGVPLFGEVSDEYPLQFESTEIYFKQLLGEGCFLKLSFPEVAVYMEGCRVLHSFFLQVHFGILLNEVVTLQEKKALVRIKEFLRTREKLKKVKN